MNKFADSEVQRLRSAVSLTQNSTGRRFAVYTTVLNDYSRVLPPPSSLMEIADFFLLTDSNEDVPGWRRLNVQPSHADLRRAAKLYKLLPHLILQDYEISLWLDGNIELLEGGASLLTEFSAADDVICLFQHRSRNCLYDEAAECKKWNKDDPKTIDAQIERYKMEGHPVGAGLFMGGLLLRRHTDQRCKAAMQLWWTELLNGSLRDQLSLPVVLQRTKLRVRQIPFDELRRYFLIHPHRKFTSHRSGKIPSPKAVFVMLAYRLGHMRSRLMVQARQIVR